MTDTAPIQATGLGTLADPGALIVRINPQNPAFRPLLGCRVRTLKAPWFAGMLEQLERFWPTTENRGVPGSSPGLAIHERPGQRRFWQLVPDTGSAQTLPRAFSGLFGASRGGDVGHATVRAAAHACSQPHGESVRRCSPCPWGRTRDAGSSPVVSCTYLAYAQAMRAGTRQRGSN